jgi:CO/xanthine dehydrogenase Mo-binding subunit
MGPACGVARWRDDHIDVWTASQGVFQLRQDLAAVFGLDESDFTLTHVEGPGCYGHNGADDAAFEAVCLARHGGGRPVRLLWSRADELGWAAYGPAAVVDLEVGVDDAGAMVRWHAELTGNGHSTRPGTVPEGPSFLSAPALGRGVARTIARDSQPLTMNGAGRNSVPCYRIPEMEILSHRLLEMPIRTSALRSLGANVNVFAIESMVDEVAAGLGVDPVAFRLAHLDDPRMREVLETAAARAGWSDERPSGTALGLAAARYKNTAAYCAVAAEVEAIDDVRVRRLTLVVDAGSVVNPDGVRNQIEGGAIQTLSWTLKERVRFDRERVTSTSWETYPILRFTEIPPLDVVLIERPDEAPLGVGEAVQAPDHARAPRRPGGRDLIGSFKDAPIGSPSTPVAG